jgi:hypothetical protein
MRKSLKRAKQECLANVAKRFALEESTGERPRSNGFAANAEPRDELRERATRDALCPTERSLSVLAVYPYAGNIRPSTGSVTGRASTPS